MSGKLKHGQFRINELEKELFQTRSNSTDTQKNAQQVQQVYDELEKKYYELRYYIDNKLFILKSLDFNKCVASCIIQNNQNLFLSIEKKRKIWNWKRQS